MGGDGGGGGGGGAIAAVSATLALFMSPLPVTAAASWSESNASMQEARCQQPPRCPPALTTAAMQCHCMQSAIFARSTVAYIYNQLW